MAFSMDQIQKNKRPKQNKINTKELFSWTSHLENISDNAKLVITTYLMKRLQMYGTNGLNSETYKYMIKNVLKNCCGKEFIDITPNDTELNLDELLFQFKSMLHEHMKYKKSLYNHNLYFGVDKLDLTRLVNPISSKNKSTRRQTLTREEIEQYFERCNII